jgi:hypothetical protein
MLGVIAGALALPRPIHAYVEGAPSTLGTRQEPKIALVRRRGDQVIAQRLLAELGALGYQVLEVSGPEAARPLVDIAQFRGFDALLRATPSRTGIELVVLLPDAAPGAELSVLEDVVSLSGGRRDDLLALRAVEALRARLLEAGWITAPEIYHAPELPPPEPDAVSVAQAAHQPDSARPGSRLWFEVAPAVAGDPAFGWAPRGQLAVRLEGAGLWSMSLIGNVPFAAARLETERGAAEVSTLWVGAAIDARLATAGWNFEVGAGLAGARLAVEGQARAPYAGRAESVTSALPFLRLATYPELSKSVRLRLELLGGFAVPRTVIGIAGADERWGAPYLQGSLGFGWAIPGVEP